MITWGTALVSDAWLSPSFPCASARSGPEFGALGTTGRADDNARGVPGPTSPASKTGPGAGQELRAMSVCPPAAGEHRSAGRGRRSAFSELPKGVSAKRLPRVAKIKKKQKKKEEGGGGKNPPPKKKKTSPKHSADRSRSGLHEVHFKNQF